MSSRFGGWAARLVLAVSAAMLSFLVVGAVGEWAVRYRERARSTVPGTMSMMFYRHSRLMHALVRGMDYFGWVHVGRQGFRGIREASLEPPDSTFRIIAAGGSTTFDANTTGDSAAWPARLEQILDSVASPRRFEVLNAGVPGFQVFDDLVRLELELHQYRPDLLILYQGHNDLYNTLAAAGRQAATGFDPRPEEIPAVGGWQLWLEHHSLLYHKFRERLRALRFRSASEAHRTVTSPDHYERALESGVAGFSRNLRMYAAVAQSLGIPVMIPQVVYAARAPAQPGDAPARARWEHAILYAPIDIVWRGYAQYDSVARAVAAWSAGVYVPASDSLWFLDGYAGDDPIHFNDAGAWRFASHLAKAVRALPETAGRGPAPARR